MSEVSREREVIHEMIEERENQIRVGNGQIDKLYEVYDRQARQFGVLDLHEEITRLYAEILLLKMVLMKADEPFDTDQLLKDAQDKFGVTKPDPLEPFLEEEFSDEGRG